MSKQEEIKDYVGRFVEGLTKLMRAAAHETVDATFADAVVSSVAIEPTRTVKSVRRAKAPRQLSAAPAEGLQKPVIAVIKANPGCGARLIADEVGRTPVQIRPLLNDLAVAGVIKKSGSGRGLTYSIR